MSPGGLTHEAPVRGATDTWLTPPWIIAALGPFDLDPCAFPGWVTAARHICWPDDGLYAPWDGRVWLNPPYGPVTGVWLQRLADHGNGTALVFARTETAAWQRHVWPHAHGILFLESRLRFHKPDGTIGRTNAGAPSVLISYSEYDTARLASSDIRGKLIYPQAKLGGAA